MSKESGKLPAPTAKSPANCSDCPAFLDEEYSTMKERWVDECCGELDSQLMRLSAVEFKRLALRPVAAPQQSPEPARSQCPSTKSEGTVARQRRRSFPRWEESGGHFANYALLVQRSSERCATARCSVVESSFSDQAPLRPQPQSTPSHLVDLREAFVTLRAPQAPLGADRTLALAVAGRRRSRPAGPVAEFGGVQCAGADGRRAGRSGVQCFPRGA